MADGRRATPRAVADESAPWFQSDRPTRAVNVSASPAEVQALCAKKAVAISAIEALPDGGTHVVLVTIDDADALRTAYKDKLLPRNTRRTPLRGRASYG